MKIRSDFNWSARFAILILPWLLAGGALLLYFCTLDHWVSLESLHEISNLTGLSWLAQLSAPASYILSYPLRWFPLNKIPLAANIFSAVCAAASLLILARAVALLPHDRTQAERQRNLNKYGFLTIPYAWMPPTLAVLVCGLQLSFWTHATSGTGEMIDLLLFATMVLCLIEYHVSRRNTWLLRFAFLSGLALANNWAMLAFFPCFVFALAWLKGLFHFFNSKHVARFMDEKSPDINVRLPLKMLGLFALGCSFFLFLPLVSSFSTKNPVSFWGGLSFEAITYPKLYTGFYWRVLLALSLTSVLPMLFMGIRWGRLMRKTSPGINLAVEWLFHSVHAFFLLLCLWASLDSPFSPHRLQPLFAFLPLYFLMALSVGYYSGYFLLVFGDRTTKSRRHSQGPSPLLNLFSVIGVWLLLLAAPAILFCKNLPCLLRLRQDVLGQYFQTVAKSLPPHPAILFSEDPLRLHFLGTSLLREGKQNDYLLIDTSLLSKYANYFKYLDARYPQFKLAQALNGDVSEIINPMTLIRWMQAISSGQEIYFMHPAVGYTGELFYTQQNPVLFQLLSYSTNALFVPALPPQLMASNQTFWQTVNRDDFPALCARLDAPRTNAANLWQKLLKRAHIRPELDRNALLAGGYYSLALNSWGAELQRNGLLKEAGDCFEQAVHLNPENAPAQINLRSNGKLQAQKPLDFDPTRKSDASLGKNRDWDQSLRQDGPTDEPNACFRLATLCTSVRMYRQALQYYDRVNALAPDAVEPIQGMAELFLRMGDNTNSVLMADRALKLSPENPRLLIMKGLALIQMKNYAEAIVPLNETLLLQSTNTDARLTRALAYLRLNKLSAAQDDYQQVAQVAPSAYPAYYGLAEIAHEKNDKAALIKNCELYFVHAPPDAPEAKIIRDWLTEAKTPSAISDGSTAK